MKGGEETSKSSEHVPQGGRHRGSPAQGGISEGTAEKPIKKKTRRLAMQKEVRAGIISMTCRELDPYLRQGVKE